MFRTKKDVDRHVTDILSKIHSENEKNTKGYTFAKLYFQAKDFETAKRYLTGFLQVRDHHAPAHKLMGQIYENDKHYENALQSYKRSLEIDSNQKDIVLKICELYCKLPVDHETAKYWADRAEDIFPHNEIVFKLRENLVSADGEANYPELEKLIKTELQSQPQNIDLKIKLLRLYIDTERSEEAYNYATEIAIKRLAPWNVQLYYLLGDIFESHQEECSQNLDSQFYIHYLSTLDHLISLLVAEPHSALHEGWKKQHSVNDAAAVLVTFDQVLKVASEKDVKESSWKHFMYHMKGQLFYHMTCVLAKRNKLEQGNHKETIKFISGLAIVCYTFKPINILQKLKFLQLEENQNIFLNFFQQASLRTSYIGHIIQDMCKEDKGKWLQKLKNEVCVPQVKERLLSRVLDSVYQKDKKSLSCFLSDSTFENCSLEFPSDVTLLDCDKTAFKLCPDSLHHLVWFELHNRKSENPVFDDNLSEVFEGLQYSNQNLSRGSCESLCVLDLEAYLWATVYQAQTFLEKKRAISQSKNQLLYPPDISEVLCSKQQACWWKAAYDLLVCSAKKKLGDNRRTLQQGLEVIRGIGNHGMETQLVVYLACSFADKAEYFEKNSDNKKKQNTKNVAALQLRSLHYWKIALGMLDKLGAGKTLGTPKDQMFSGSGKSISKNEVSSLREQGKLYIAVHLMNSDKLDEAAEMLSTLSSPHGSYYLALTLKRLAAQEEHFSKTRTALLTRAKNAIHETMDRIKEDRSHPLNQELYLVLEDVENELASDLSINNSHDDEVDEVDSYSLSPALNHSVYMTPGSHVSATAHSTPRPSSKFISVNHKSISVKKEVPKHFEPSPERLDAQLRALTMNQDTLMKSFIEQQKSIAEINKSIAEALKQNTDVMEQLRKSIDEMKISSARGHPKPSSRKTSYTKGQGDEEDYSSFDPTMLEYYQDEAGDDYRAAYPYASSTRMVHEAAAPLNYVMPPGPPQPPFNYQYPHLPAPQEPAPFYAPGHGLPFSEGQQLPQFQFHVASPVVKPRLPPPPPLQSPWAKGVPHAFQIPLPASSAFPPPPVQTTPAPSELKALLTSPPGHSSSTVGQSNTPLASVSPGLFAGFGKTPELAKTDLSRCDSDNAGSPDIDGQDLEKEVMGDFKPLIPLPAEIVVETGEENEEVLFEDRAKLYRFAVKEWKERGIGIVKILRDKQSGRVRLLMRRDQVLKVCANHYITSNMEIQPLKSSDCAWTWVAQDFADEELKPEHFCIRFKTVELAGAFKAAFDKALTISKEDAYKKIASAHISTSKAEVSTVAEPFGASFLPKSGSWTCATCYVSNGPEKLFCLACEEKKPGLQIPAVSPLNGTSQSPAPSSLTPTSTPKASVGGFTFSSPPSIRESESPSLKEREILVVSGKSKNGLQVTKVNQLNSPFSNFSFTKAPTTTSSSLTVQFSDIGRNVAFGSTTTMASSTTSSVLTPSADNSLSKLQSMVSGFGQKEPTAQKPPVPKSPGEVEPEEFVPTAEFKPVVPLPALVDLKTGEEEEEKLFGEKAKLFRYDLAAKEWKERGLGELKILHQQEGDKYRVLMRRELVLKLCANHYILPEMKLSPMAKSDKAWIWFAQDYSDGEVKDEQFAARFKTAEIAHNFKEVFQSCQKKLESSTGKEIADTSLSDLFKPKAGWWQCTTCYVRNNPSSSKCVSCETPKPGSTPAPAPVVKPSSDIPNSFGDIFKPEVGSWECTTCYVRNNPSSSKCVSCETPKPGSTPAPAPVVKPSSDIPNSFGDIFKPEVGSWECTTCYVRNNPSSSKCVSCETPKPGSTPAPAPVVKPSSDIPNSFGDIFKPEAGSWECTTCYVRNNPSSSKCVSCETPKPGSTPAPAPVVKPSSDIPNSFGDIFKPEAGSWECTTCYVRNNPSSSKCASCETSKPGSTSTPEVKPETNTTTFTMNQKGGGFSFGSSQFTFGKPQSEGFVFGTRPSTQPSNFSFGQTSLVGEGFSPSLPASNAPAVFGGVTSTPSTVFGANTSASKFDFSSFASPQKSDGAPQEFKFGSPQKYEFNFPGVRPRSPSKTPKSPRSPQAPSDVEEEVEDSDADGIYFTPVIPLPPKVDVKTGEEDEKPLFCKRAKLFRFSNGEWKERGIGDIKILLDEKSNKLRLLMRRDQVLKVCLNHQLTKGMSFEWQTDKSLTWTATDFSENTPSPELLAVRFKTIEQAQEFKEAISSAMERVKGASSVQASPSSQAISKAASSFSFKTESNFSSGALASQFSTPVQEKSLNTGGFSFSDAAPSPFSNLFKDKPPTSSFFAAGSGFGSSTPASDESTKPQTDDPDVQVINEITASKEQVERALALLLPKNFFLYENKEKSCSGCIGCEDKIPPYKDVADEPEEKKDPTPQKSPTAAPVSGELFSNSKLQTFSFSDLAASSSFDNLAKSSPLSKNVFADAGKPIFSNLNNSADDGNEDVYQGPDIHFEPIIPLPDLVEVTTGEEDETVLFLQRAKLYRYDGKSKEWKERGVGDIKILRHKEKTRFRVIMRRDQVHNVACNHCISEDMALSLLPTSEKTLCWNAVDYSDKEVVPSQFAVRFKNKDLMNQFKQVFTECQEMLKISKEVEKSSATSNQVDSTTEEGGHNSTDEDEEEQDLLFVKRATLEIFDETTKQFKSAGIGELTITYDGEVFGYRICMENDQGELLCDHIIAVQTCLREDGKRALWAAVDLASEPPARKQFRVTFCSQGALKEFSKVFEEGKESAAQIGIVENS